jgi:2-polyprenyl-6-methoxyphenol hydroxylase-like FAD-dependent oxidoreductase
VAIDVVIVGAGLGGATTAAVLSRAGLDVVIVDRHAAYPADFRAEQLVGSQTDALRRLGLLEGIVGQTTPMLDATSACYGKVIDQTHSLHYGLHYADMVNAARSLAVGAKFITGRATQVTTGPDLQTVVLADGTALEARLVVLATGPNDGSLLAPLGISRTMLSEHHSLTFGFDLHTTLRRILVCYGERPGDRMDYLAIFPIGGVMRANLFCYLDPDDPWVKLFKGNPKQALLGVMPSLEQTTGPFEVLGKVQVRPNSIHRADNAWQRQGVVLIGDAYQSSCPAVGTGIGRILTDVEALSRFLPSWLATPGMGIEKLAQFYKDPTKRRFDGRAIQDARFRRAICSEADWRWRAYRTQHYYRLRILGTISRAMRRDTPAVGSVTGKTQHAVRARTGAARTRLVLTWAAAKRAVAAVITLMT